MSTPILGDGVAIDVDRLLVSRLLLQANSGGGKSYALRRLLEQTHGHCQHIVIDPEGEFHTLRERFDYVLAGKGGDCAASVDTAELLARRLLELGVSAVVDISELGQNRPAFVAKFLDALVGAPRELWHPVLVVVDEAHKFCPEKGKARKKAERVSIEDSSAAVVALMDSGRKRGFCGVLATQRISKLNKDATAECNNKLIGRSVELDAKRAAEELGLASREAIQQLRKLRAGEFFVFGPALSDEVRVMRVGPVQTTHPEAGKAAPPPTPPRTKVREVLGELADLPAEAEHEARTADGLRARIRELESALVAAKRATPEPLVQRIEVPAIDAETLASLRNAVARMGEHTAELDRIRDRLAQAQQTVVSEADNLRTFTAQLSRSPNAAIAGQHFAHDGKVAKRVGKHQIRVPSQAAPKNAVKPWPGPPPTGASLVPAQQRIVDTMATLKALGIESTRKVVAAWLGMHPNTKGFVNNIGALRSAGLVDDFALTAGGERVGRANVPRSNAEVREVLVRPLSPAQRRIVDAVAQLGKADRDELAEMLGQHPNTKGLVNNIGALRGRALLTEGWPLQLERVFQVGAR